MAGWERKPPIGSPFGRKKLVTETSEPPPAGAVTMPLPPLLPLPRNATTEPDRDGAWELAEKAVPNELKGPEIVSVIFVNVMTWPGTDWAANTRAATAATNRTPRNVRRLSDGMDHSPAEAACVIMETIPLGDRPCAGRMLRLVGALLGG